VQTHRRDGATADRQLAHLSRGGAPPFCVTVPCVFAAYKELRLEPYLICCYLCAGRRIPEQVALGSPRGAPLGNRPHRRDVNLQGMIQSQNIRRGLAVAMPPLGCAKKRRDRQAARRSRR